MKGNTNSVQNFRVCSDGVTSHRYPGPGWKVLVEVVGYSINNALDDFSALFAQSAKTIGRQAAGHTSRPDAQSKLCGPVVDLLWLTRETTDRTGKLYLVEIPGPRAATLLSCQVHAQQPYDELVGLDVLLSEMPPV
jgi:hypothetical protein